MKYDIFKSIPQGSYAAYDEENRRIREIVDEIQRLCGVYETELRNGQANGSRFEIEQRATEQFYNHQTI